MWASDRDLLAIEPNLFRDVAWAGQTVFTGNASIGAGGTTTLSSPMRVAPATAAGMVLLVRRAAVEIVAAASATALTTSLLRAQAGEAVIAPEPETNAPAAMISFRPQIALAHRQLLAMLGLSPGAGLSAEGRLGESSVTNASELVMIEALGALHLIYSAAAALGGEDGPGAVRARMYRERFARERWAVSAMIDEDGDGLADVVRRLNVTRLSRA